MRTVILITAMVLASATAQASDLRSLSTGLATDTQADRPAPAPSAMRAENPSAADTPRYAPPPAATATQNEPSRNTSDTPRYNTRPAPVEPAPTTTATTPPQSRQSIADRDTPRSEPSYHPSPSRMRYRPVHVTQRYGAIRWPRPHLPHRWSTGRIIAALHRYGIYW